MSVVHPWGIELPDRWLTDITPSSMPSSLPCLGVNGFFLRGRSHVLAAKAKVGKTSLIFHLCQEWTEALSDACPDMVWISEEAEEVWGWRRSRLRVEKIPLQIRYHHESTDWFSYVSSCPFEVVIIDTASAVMGLVDESDQREVNRLLRMWTDMANLQNRTLIILHHHRKSEGSGGDQISGAGAWTRVPDMLLELRLEDDLRYLTARGRYPSPGSVYYDDTFSITEKKVERRKRCRACGELFSPPASFPSALICWECHSAGS